MPPQTQVNPLFAKHAKRFAAVAAAVADKPVEYDKQAKLPANVQNGVGRLTTARLGEYKTGKTKDMPFLIFSAATLFPSFGPNGEPVKGLPTQMGPMPLCATGTPGTDQYKTEEFNTDRALNVVKLLLGDGDHTEAVLWENLESTLAALEAYKPTFMFRTWAGAKEEIVEVAPGKWEIHVKNQKKEGTRTYKTEAELRKDKPYAGQEPQVQHVWNRTCVWNEGEAGEPGAGTEDETAAEPAKAAPAKPAAPAAPKPAPAAAANKPPAKPPSKVAAAAPPPPPDPEPGYSDDTDLLSLGIKAEKGDKPAQQSLAEFAVAAGWEKTADGEGWVDPQMDQATWTEMAAMLAAPAADEPESAADEKPAVEVGQMYKVTVAGKVVEIEVTAVDPAKGVQGTDMIKQKPLMDPKKPKTQLWIPFDQLESTDG